MFEFQIQATRMDPGLAPYYSLTQGVINGTFNPHSIGLYLNTSINCKLPENAGDYQFNEFPEVGWIPLEVKSEAGINVIDGERNDQDLILKIRHGEEFSFEGKQVLDNGIIKQYKLEAKLSPNQCNQSYFSLRISRSLPQFILREGAINDASEALVKSKSEGKINPDYCLIGTTEDRGKANNKPNCFSCS